MSPVNHLIRLLLDMGFPQPIATMIVFYNLAGQSLVPFAKFYGSRRAHQERYGECLHQDCACVMSEQVRHNKFRQRYFYLEMEQLLQQGNHNFNLLVDHYYRLVWERWNRQTRQNTRFNNMARFLLDRTVEDYGILSPSQVTVLLSLIGYRTKNIRMVACNR
jgi:hypothetical protein